MAGSLGGIREEMLQEMEQNQDAGEDLEGNLEAQFISEIYSDTLVDDSIRILVLEPGGEGSRLRCSLVTTSVADKYEAISYAWGNPEDTAEIECNEMPLRVTANLAEALGQLRYGDRPRRLWADAICINQKNIEERSRHVQKMGRVYEGAETVLVCLGRDSAGIAEDCFTLIRETNQHLGELLQRWGHWGNLPSLVTSTSIESDAARWNKLKILSALPWFSRLWVIQETGLAKQCIIHWGESTMAFAEYVELQLWLTKRPDIRIHCGPINDVRNAECYEYIQCRFNNIKSWRRDKPLASFRERMIRPIPTAFVNVLAAGRRSKATDARDHVYGFLGNPLAVVGDDGLVVIPDYKKTWQEVYFNTACALLDQPREAPYLLSHVHHISEDDMNCSADLPSWVPRWDQDAAPAALGNPQHWFSARGPRSTFQVRVNSDKSVSVRGLKFDHISWVSQPVFDYNLSIDQREWETRFSAAGVPFVDVLYQEVSENWPHSKEKLLYKFPFVLAVGFAPWPFEHASKMSKDRGRYEDYLDIVRRAATTRGSDIKYKDQDGYSEGLDYAFHLKHAHNRRLFRTRSGRLGLGPLVAKDGDVCFLVSGAPVPFVLRPAKQGGYHLVGECYIDGLMAGEPISWVPGRSNAWRFFTIW